MKKVLLLSTLLLVFFLTAGIASAWVSFRFGLPLPPVVIGPPVIEAPPPPYYPNAYYPDPYGYYSYPYGYYGFRARVPGYWGYGGRARAWGPGYWGYGGRGRARIPGYGRYRR